MLSLLAQAQGFEGMLWRLNIFSLIKRIKSSNMFKATDIVLGAVKLIVSGIRNQLSQDLKHKIWPFTDTEKSI